MARRLVWTTAALIGAIALAALVFVWSVLEGGLGRDQGAGRITGERIPAAQIAARDRRRQQDAHSLGAGAPRSGEASQILFGDLHVHTTYSSGCLRVQRCRSCRARARILPADACDFARFCAEPRLLEHQRPRRAPHPAGSGGRRGSRFASATRPRATPADPDLVSFLGWEWTQMRAGGPGHRAHPLRAQERRCCSTRSEGRRCPARPIGAGRGGLFPMQSCMGPAGWAFVRSVIAASDDVPGNLRPYARLQPLSRGTWRQDSRILRGERARPRSLPAGLPRSGADSPRPALRASSTSGASRAW